MVYIQSYKKYLSIHLFRLKMILYSSIQVNMIHPTLSIHPILLPQHCFTDMFGKPNAYIPMNPSMWIEPNGTFTILVRCINYRKFHNKQFTLYEHRSNSKYMCLQGSFVPYRPLSLESCTVAELQLTQQSTYPTYWTGPEDIRFIDSKSVLVNIPEYNPSGHPAIFYAKLDSSSSTLTDPRACLPNVSPEKNWMPFQTDSHPPRVLYSLTPFVLKSILTDEKEIIPLSQTLEHALDGYHGSTNGILTETGEHLFLIHANKERTVHRWLRFHPTSHKISISPSFTFFKHSYIEFPCSLSEWNHSYFIGLGVNDDQAMIIEVSKYTVQNHTWIE